MAAVKCAEARRERIVGRLNGAAVFTMPQKCTACASPKGSTAWTTARAPSGQARYHTTAHFCPRSLTSSLLVATMAGRQPYRVYFHPTKVLARKRRPTCIDWLDSHPIDMNTSAAASATSARHPQRDRLDLPSCTQAGIQNHHPWKKANTIRQSWEKNERVRAECQS